MISTFPANLLVFNDKGANEPQLREVVNLLRDERIDIHTRVTQEKDDAARFIDEALQLNVETMTVGGGDGIIDGVMTTLVERGSKMALGILPLDTVNDSVTSVSIPQDLASALKLTIAGRDMPIDIVRVNDKTGFINMAIGGFGTRVTTETSEKLGTALGGVSYLIHGLMRMDTLKPDRCKIRGENFHWQGDALVIGISNGRQVGGGQQLCPETSVNDGLLHLRIFTGEELIPVLSSTLANPGNLPNIVDGVSSWSEIIASREMTFNLDSELFSGKTFRMELLPAALRCRLLPDCLLLR